MYKKFIALALAVAVIAGGHMCTGRKAEAAKKYPSRPITMIVNFSAGGGTDLAARALADAASKRLGVHISIKNVPGALGSVGLAELKDVKPDGYTIGVATYGSIGLAPHHIKVPYVPEDFKYICSFGKYGYGIVVGKNSKYKTFKDLVEAGKKETIKFGATGVPQPFVMFDVNKMAGTKFEFVSYPKTSDMGTDILGGFLPFAVADMGSFAQYVKSGDMVMLASAIDERWSFAPDVPTLKELGYDTSLKAFFGLAAPKDTPDECIAILRKAFEEACKDPQFQQILERCNQRDGYMSGEDFEKLLKTTYVEYGKEVKNGK